MQTASSPLYFAKADRIALPTGGKDYQPHTAWWLAQCAWLAYDSKINITQTLKRVGFDRVYFFGQQGTQGFLTTHPGRDEPFAILSFRGTEKNHIDILTDILLLGNKLPDLADKQYGDGPLFAHKGFLQAFQQVWGSVLPSTVRSQMRESEWVGPPGISNILEGRIRDWGMPLFVTGHSIGGAIATLTAYHAMPHHPNTYLYTFGSPRVVNRWLSHKINNALQRRSFRCVHGNDIVPRLPILFNYTHIQALVYFDPKKGCVSAKRNMRSNLLVIVLLHLDAFIFFLTLRLRQPETTVAHKITAYVQAIERDALKPRNPLTPVS